MTTRIISDAPCVIHADSTTASPVHRVSRDLLVLLRKQVRETVESPTVRASFNQVAARATGGKWRQDAQSDFTPRAGPPVSAVCYLDSEAYLQTTYAHPTPHDGRGDRGPPSIARKKNAPRSQRQTGVVVDTHFLPFVPERRSSRTISETAQKEEFVRDYFFRANLIEQYGAPTNAIDDELFNGVGLCRLSWVLEYLYLGEENTPSLYVPHVTPKSHQHTGRNFAYAIPRLKKVLDHLDISYDLLPLSSPAVACMAQVPPLLDFCVCTIQPLLPAVGQIPRESAFYALFSEYHPSMPGMVWQEMERQLCGRLTELGVLLDPSGYALPEDDGVICHPLSAPVLLSQTKPTPRCTVPSSLCIPSVWPYLCNGVVLHRLAERFGQRGGSFHLNPRSETACLANLSRALEFLCVDRGLTGLVPSLEDVCGEIYHGRKAVILLLLCEILGVGIQG
ncbi:hypothetical protein ADEAN_000154900 [Angomonas deanei]|uniref:Uncharacterized protein n=1 Tax=Angomonas deanei TaxID=59799 RepID=A0A7G2C3K5_9TRYP|nr:hypothetical protein ADEAN_000154900 [Angomonas deanei]